VPLLHEILAKKKLDPRLFDQDVILLLEAPINLHVSWLYNNIYSMPYPKSGKPAKIARQIHGIQHVTRAAINIPIFANLYRLYGYNEALTLNDEDIKLLQIAALFHDSARENEDVDYWDQDSGLFFYQYAINILHVDAKKGKLLAEAIANKDADESNYFELVDGLTWVKRVTKLPKNIHQKLIHDADCLEIIRARDHFDANHLDFYKDIAKSNEEAFEIMAKLITEARSLIAFQGDNRTRIDISIKLKYEHQNAHRDIINFISEHKEFYPLIIALSNNPPPLRDEPHHQLHVSVSKEASSEVTESLLVDAMYSGQLFARGVGSPAFIIGNGAKKVECAAELEIRKMMRTLGTPTRTEKPNNLEKLGNPNRSVTMISYGAGIFASQGFLILKPNIDHVGAICCVDMDSHSGKKSHIKEPEISREEKINKLKDLHKLLKMGGSSRRFAGSLLFTHNEILYRITKADAIYFTQDPTLHNQNIYDDASPINAYTHYLQALFLQIEYQKATGILLPIFEYSGVHNFIKSAPIYSEEEIVAMWVEMVSEQIKKHLKSFLLSSYSIESLKLEAIYGCTDLNKYIKKQTVLDLNYSQELIVKINSALLKEEKKCLLEHGQKIIEGIRSGHLSVFSDDFFCTLVKSPQILYELKDEIKYKCIDFVNVEFKNPIEYCSKQNSADINFNSIELYFNRNDLRKVYFFSRIFNTELSVQIEKKIDEVILYYFNQLFAGIYFNDNKYLHIVTILESLTVILAEFDKFNEYKDKLTMFIIYITEYLNNKNNIYGFQLCQIRIGNVGFMFGGIKEQIDKIRGEFLARPDNEFQYGELVRKSYIRDYKVPEKTLYTFLIGINKGLVYDLANKDFAEDKSLADYKQELAVNFIKNFFVSLSISRNWTSSWAHLRRLKSQVVFSDDELQQLHKQLVTQGLDNAVAMDIFRYQINRVLLHAILVSPRDWTANYTEALKFVMQLLFQPISPDDSLALRTLKASYPADLNLLNNLWLITILKQTSFKNEAVKTRLWALCEDVDRLNFIRNSQGLFNHVITNSSPDEINAIIIAVQGQLYTLIKDGNQLGDLFSMPMVKLNARHREFILTNIQGHLPILINNGYQLCFLLQIPLDKLNVKHRDQIFTAIKGRLGTLIEDAEQLQFLLKLPLEQLNMEQRELIFTASQDHFSTLIKDGMQLCSLLSLPLELLNYDKREQIFMAVQVRLGDLIQHSEQLKYLLMLDVEKLNAAQRRQIWVAAESRLGDLIENSYRLYSLLTLPDTILNTGQRDIILKMVEGKLGVMFHSAFALLNLLQLPESKLNTHQREVILFAVKSKLSELIVQESDLHQFLKLPESKLNSHQRVIIWMAVQDKLDALIYNLYDFLSMPEFILNTSQRDQILIAVKDKLGKLIKDERDLCDLLQLSESQLNTKQRDIILSAFLNNPNKGMMPLYLLSLPESQLKSSHRDMVWTAYQNNLPTLIKNVNVFLNLLQLPEPHLNTSQRDQLWTVAQYELGTFKTASPELLNTVTKLDDIERQSAIILLGALLKRVPDAKLAIANASEKVLEFVKYYIMNSGCPFNKLVLEDINQQLQHRIILKGDVVEPSDISTATAKIDLSAGRNGFFATDNKAMDGFQEQHGCLLRVENKSSVI